MKRLVALPPPEVEIEPLIADFREMLAKNGAKCGIMVFEDRNKDLIFRQFGRKEPIDIVAMLEWMKLRIFTDAKGLTCNEEVK